MSNFELKNFASDVELAEYTAALWLEQVRKKPAQNVALSGGTITRLFFQKIAERAIAEKIFLSDVHFFWADERCVPPTDPESNFALANENLFSRLNIQPDKIHRLCGELDQSEAVAQANHEINRVISPGTAGLPALDIVFLGLGPDGHVASLFPNARLEVLTCEQPFVSVENSPKPPPRRISLSYAAIAAAKEVWVLVSGNGKEKALRESLEMSCQQDAGSTLTSLARVLQMRQQTKIFTDVKFE
ncbi:MAG: 6-phosphogluconolactonase [Verrucomicrobiota bacterium]